MTSVFESNSLTAESAPGRGNFTPFDVRGGFGSVVVFWGNQCKHYTVPNTTGVARVSLDFRVCPMSLFDRTSTYVLGGFYAHMDAAGRVTRGDARGGPRGDNDGNSRGHGSGGNGDGGGGDGDRDGDSGGASGDSGTVGEGNRDTGSRGNIGGNRDGGSRGVRAESTEVDGESSSAVLGGPALGSEGRVGGSVDSITLESAS